MKVIDSSVVVALLINALDFDQVGDEVLAAPHLLDSEVINALRNLVRSGALTPSQGETAFAGFLGLHLTRFPAEDLRPRIWELRHNLSAYDATYVALTESLGAAALLTTDARLANAPGVTCPVELLRRR